MPVIVILGEKGGGPAKVRQRVTLPLNVAVDTQRSALPLYVTTAAVRSRAAMSLSVVTLDLSTVDLPPPAALPVGDVTHPYPRAFLITHGGLPAETLSYSIGTQNDMPTMQATVRGRIDAPESMSILAAAAPLAGGAGYRAVYGPFSRLQVSYTQTPEGWTTRIYSADTTEKDAAESLDNYGESILPEFLPWEIEKDLTPLAAAEKARADALKKRALKKVKCKDKDPVDRRSETVHSLIWWLLGRLPASLPWVVNIDLPYPGERFWASQDTQVPYRGGILNGVSYQTKGKKPLEVLRDILGRAGWQLVLKQGILTIGPPPPLIPKGATSGSIGVPEEYLTERTEEIVNADTSLSDVPIPKPLGNFDLPLAITAHLATARKYRPPLLDLPPESAFELDPNGELVGGSSVTSPDANGRLRTESTTSWKKQKAGGTLSYETSVTHGVVPDVRINFTFRTVQLESWQLMEDKTTSYVYDDPLYPKAMTSSLSVTRAYNAFVKEVVESERITATQDWHESGWLRRKSTIKLTGESYGQATVGTGPNGPQLFRYVIFQKEVQTETWTPSRPGEWIHQINTFRPRPVAVYEGADPDSVVMGGGMNVTLNELTDQGPPLAPEGECSPDDLGSPYDEANDQSRFTGGRGDEREVDIPWATQLPLNFFENQRATLRQARKKDNKARPSRRLTYTCAVPPQVTIGGPVKEFSATGSEGKFSATITVEEALEAEEAPPGGDE